MLNWLNDYVHRYDLYDVELLIMARGNTAFHAYVSHPDVPEVYDSNRLMRVASISKLVVAIAVMQQVENGNMQLEERGDHYLGFPLVNPHHPTIPITVQMLLTHTSSLQDTDPIYIPMEESIALRYDSQRAYCQDDMFIRDNGRWVKPGERYHYSNQGYQLLATILERVTNERFDHYVQNHIFTPLGMMASFDRQDDRIQDRVRPLYRKEQNKWTPQIDGTIEKRKNYTKYKLGTNGSVFGPQGGLRTNATELQKLMVEWMNPSKGLLQPNTWNQMMSIVVSDQQGDMDLESFPCNYGLGCHIITPRSINRPIASMTQSLVGHSGVAYGFHGLFYFEPDTGNGIIALCGGHGRPLDTYKGRHSGFRSFEEDIMTHVNDQYWRMS